MSNIAPPPPAHRLSTLIALVLIAALGPAAAFAELKTWDGGGGADKRWLEPTNWNPDGVPTDIDDVRIKPPTDSVVDFVFDQSNPHFNLLGLTEPFDVRVAKSIEIGTGTKFVTVRMAPFASFGTTGTGGFKIGTKGIVMTEGPSMWFNFHAGLMPAPGNEFDSTAFVNEGVFRLARLLGEKRSFIKGSYQQMGTGTLQFELPPDPSTEPMLAIFAGGNLSIDGSLEIEFPSMFAPVGGYFALLLTITDAPSSAPIDSFDTRRINGVVGDRFHPGAGGGIVAELLDSPIGILCRAAVLGDMNGDGVVDGGDISPFELALADPATYDATYPMIDRIFVGDINNDGAVDAFDIAGFEQLLLGQGVLFDPEVFVQMMEAFMVE